MRYLFIPLFILFMLILPLNAYPEQAKTIDELVAMYDDSICAGCHSELYDEWKKSKHSYSVIDSNVLKTFRTFILEGLEKEKLGREVIKECLNCHVPIIKDASPELIKQVADMIVTAADERDKTKRDAVIKELSKLNVNCLGCHNYTRIAYPFSPDVQQKPNTIYVPEGKDIARDSHKGFGYDTVKSVAIKKAEMCGSCHHGCPPDIKSDKCPTGYTEYIEHYVEKGGKSTCQDCHMKKWGHRFPGSDDVKYFSEGIDLKLNARQANHIDHLNMKRSPAVVIKLDVESKAGHGIPHG